MLFAGIVSLGTIHTDHENELTRRIGVRRVPHFSLVKSVDGRWSSYHMSSPSYGHASVTKNQLINFVSSSLEDMVTLLDLSAASSKPPDRDRQGRIIGGSTPSARIAEAISSFISATPHGSSSGAGSNSFNKALLAARDKVRVIAISTDARSRLALQLLAIRMQRFMAFGHLSASSMRSLQHPAAGSSDGGGIGAVQLLERAKVDRETADRILTSAWSDSDDVLFVVHREAGTPAAVVRARSWQVSDLVSALQYHVYGWAPKLSAENFFPLAYIVQAPFSFGFSGTLFPGGQRASILMATPEGHRKLTLLTVVRSSGEGGMAEAGKILVPLALASSPLHTYIMSGALQLGYMPRSEQRTFINYLLSVTGRKSDATVFLIKAYSSEVRNARWCLVTC